MSSGQPGRAEPHATQFRRCMGLFATGVTVVAVQHEGEYAGMTLNAFSSVSLTPLLVSVSLAHDTRTLRLVHDSRRFAVSILNCDQIEVARAFAVPGAPFPRDHIVTQQDGHARVMGALAYIACEVTQEVTAGDHDIVIGRVTDLHAEEGQPLIFHGGDFSQIQPPPCDARSAA